MDVILAENGIKVLELDNSNPTSYIVPSCIFSCSSLIELKLRNCVSKPPYNFRGFYYLINLELFDISFSSGIFATLLQNAPVLKKLIIARCTGVEHRSIHAPILDFFYMVRNNKVDWQWFESNGQLTAVQVELGIEVKNNEGNISMMKFLKHIPKISKLWLDGFSLKYLAAGNPSQSLAAPRLPCAPAPFLTRVRLNNFGVDDLDQVSSAFCLLKSSPNLKILELIVATLTNNVPEPINGYLEPSNCMDFSLDVLLTVKIKGTKGLKAELLFIKLLLARSTCLQRMIIEQSSAIGASDGFKMSRDLLQFTLASSRAEIILVVAS